MIILAVHTFYLNLESETKALALPGLHIVPIAAVYVAALCFLLCQPLIATLEPPSPHLTAVKNSEEEAISSC